MAEIGFCTGCLYRTSFSMLECLNLYSSIGSDAVELSLAGAKDLDTFVATAEIKKALSKFRYVSIHAPFMGISYGRNEDSEQAISRLAQICRDTNAKCIVVHPDNVEDFSVLEESGLPFAIENMDSAKSKGKGMADFLDYSEKTKLGFVIDLQHAYENDSSMELAMGLLGIMGRRLAEIHISGQTGSSRHLLTYSSENRVMIEKALSKCPAVPVICEGLIEEKHAQKAARERDYLKRLLF